MRFSTAIKVCLKKYFAFSGRAMRSEFWWFYLFNFGVAFIFGFVEGFARAISGNDPSTGSLISASNIFIAVMLLPSFAVAWRRMHDIGKPGWMAIAPIALGIVGLIIFILTVEFIENRGIQTGLTYRSGQIIGFFFTFLPSLYVLFLCIRPSDSGPNKYGPSPLEVAP